MFLQGSRKLAKVAPSATIMMVTLILAPSTSQLDEGFQGPGPHGRPAICSAGMVTESGFLGAPYMGLFRQDHGVGFL